MGTWIAAILSTHCSSPACDKSRLPQGVSVLHHSHRRVTNTGFCEGDDMLAVIRDSRWHSKIGRYEPIACGFCEVENRYTMREYGTTSV